jgi:hypothetical protein
MDEDNQIPIDYTTQTKVSELAQLLNQTKSHAVGKSGENSIHEANWAASHLLTKFLMHSEVLETFPDRENVEYFLQSKGFELSQLQNLEKKFWVRFVLGKLHIPRSIQAAIRVIESTIRNDSDKKAIDEYAKKLGKDKEILEQLAGFLKKTNHFWLSRALVIKLRDAHRKAHAKTPTTKELVVLGFIEPHKNNSQDGFILVFQSTKIDSTNNLWQVLHNQISALLWELLCHNSSFGNDTQRVVRWLKRISELDEIYWVEEYISPENRERLVVAIREVLKSEPDIQGRENELQKLRCAS